MFQTAFLGQTQMLECVSNCFSRPGKNIFLAMMYRLNRRSTKGSGKSENEGTAFLLGVQHKQSDRHLRHCQVSCGQPKRTRFLVMARSYGTVTFSDIVVLLDVYELSLWASSKFETRNLAVWNRTTHFRQTLIFSPFSKKPIHTISNSTYFSHTYTTC